MTEQGYRIGLLVVGGALTIFALRLIWLNLRHQPLRTVDLVASLLAFLLGGAVLLNALAQGRYESFGQGTVSSSGALPVERIVTYAPATPDPDDMFLREPGRVPAATPGG